MNLSPDTVAMLEDFISRWSPKDATAKQWRRELADLIVAAVEDAAVTVGAAVISYRRVRRKGGRR